MIHKIFVDGFKSLRKFEIELGLVNVFIGANGSGKSNILEAIGVLSSAASGRIDDEALIRRGVRPGLPSLYKSSFKGDRTPPHITLSAHAADADYKVSLLNPLQDPKPAWEFKTEKLKAKKKVIVSRGVRQQQKYKPTHGLAALKTVELDKDDPAARLLGALQDYAIYSPHTGVLRGVEPDQQTREPVGLSGGNFATAMHELKALSVLDERIETAVDDVLSCIGWVEDFDTSESANQLLSSSVPRLKKVLRFTDRYMVKDRNRITAYDASEGALYALFATVLALSPFSPSFLSVDNLDHALNPRLVRELSRLLCEWVVDGGKQQIAFTAHNPAVVDGLNLENDFIRLFAVDRDNKGQSQVNRVIISPELADLANKKDWPLSRLWVMGHIGGVPNV